MAAISWPTQLPARPLLSGHAVKADSGIIRTQMDNGLARQRKRAGTPTSRLAVSWSMNGAQAALFKAWVVDRAANGAAWFNIDLILDSGERTCEARFVADVQYRLIANGRTAGTERYIVSSEIEIKDTPEISYEVAELLVDPGLDALLAMQAAMATVDDGWFSRFPA